jgi:hypothetical protein
MKIDHGTIPVEAGDERERPAPTHRPVDPSQGDEERARGAGERTATVPHLLGPADVEAAETAAQAAETKNEREARRKREARAAAKAAKEKAGS